MDFPLLQCCDCDVFRVAHWQYNVTYWLGDESLISLRWPHCVCNNVALAIKKHHWSPLLKPCWILTHFALKRPTFASFASASAPFLTDESSWHKLPGYRPVKIESQKRSGGVQITLWDARPMRSERGEWDPFLPFTYRFINSIHKIGRLSRSLPRDLSRQTRPNLSSISPWSGRRLLTLIPRLDRRGGGG